MSSNLPNGYQHHISQTLVGVSKNRGTPKWMVKLMENPINPWMIWGDFTHYFWKHPSGGTKVLIHLRCPCGSTSLSLRKTSQQIFRTRSFRSSTTRHGKACGGCCGVPHAFCKRHFLAMQGVVYSKGQAIFLLLLVMVWEFCVVSYDFVHFQD